MFANMVNNGAHLAWQTSPAGLFVKRKRCYFRFCLLYMFPDSGFVRVLLFQLVRLLLRVVFEVGFLAGPSSGTGTGGQTKDASFRPENLAAPDAEAKQMGNTADRRCNVLDPLQYYTYNVAWNNILKYG